jgi:hypothetical protein
MHCGGQCLVSGLLEEKHAANPNTLYNTSDMCTLAGSAAALGWQVLSCKHMSSSFPSHSNRAAHTAVRHSVWGCCTQAVLFLQA